MGETIDEATMTTDMVVKIVTDHRRVVAADACKICSCAIAATSYVPCCDRNAG